MAAESPKDLIPHFPNEISEDILARLPVKYLVRLSCVSTSWYDLIILSSKQGGINSFARSHLRQILAGEPPRRVWLNNPNHKGSGGPPGEPPWRIWLNNPNHKGSDPPGPHRPVCPDCNKIPDFDAEEIAEADLLHCNCNADLKIYLWNPALRQSILLPRSIDYGFLTLAVGFGYDSRSQDYVVAKYQSHQSPLEANQATYKFDVYSLKTHSWTTLFSSVMESPRYNKNNRPPNGILDFNNFSRGNRACIIDDGFCYWNHGFDRVHYVQLGGENDTGSFRVPVDFISGDANLRLYKGSLALFGMTRLKLEHGLWTMEGNDHSANVWVKQFSVPGSLGYFTPANSTINVTPGGKILGYVHIPQRWCTQTLVVYDPENEGLEIVRDGVSQLDTYFLDDNYVESLVPVVPASYVVDEGVINDVGDGKKLSKPKAKKAWDN
ncbi:OLC1v1031578C1 [Oldenlandia corymbosa var. corymbosa]|uniref:OLC1v1031578C1 n=1 Tax=Oldenlandia corymbosa var. corymbosa TaxID=529605 RepID=A0AAV1CKL5_OLDCO|nr:OLC1v1031578C1 [Oldenlandia corymbosa var. corymbosa]